MSQNEEAASRILLTAQRTDTQGIERTLIITFVIYTEKINLDMNTGLCNFRVLILLLRVRMLRPYIN